MSTKEKCGLSWPPRNLLRVRVGVRARARGRGRIRARVWIRANPNLS